MSNDFSRSTTPAPVFRRIHPLPFLPVLAGFTLLCGCTLLVQPEVRAENRETRALSASTAPASRSWRMVAAAPVILVGTFTGEPAPPTAVDDFYRQKVQVSRVLKGKAAVPGQEIIVKIFDPDAYARSAVRNAGRECIVFMSETGGAAPYEILRFQETLLTQIQREVENQKRINTDWKILQEKPFTAADQRVRKIIDGLTVDEETAKAAVRRLETLRGRELFSLVRLMDDRRQTATDQIGFTKSEKYLQTVTNPTGLMEGQFVQDPICVLYTISEILKFQTALRIEPSGFPPSENDYEFLLRGWRVWAYYNFMPRPPAR